MGELPSNNYNVMKQIPNNYNPKIQMKCENCNKLIQRGSTGRIRACCNEKLSADKVKIIKIN